MAEVFWQSKAFWLRPEGMEPTCSSLPPPHPCAQAVPVFPRKKKVEFQVFLILLAHGSGRFAGFEAGMDRPRAGGKAPCPAAASQLPSPPCHPGLPSGFPPARSLPAGRARGSSVLLPRCGYLAEELLGFTPPSLFLEHVGEQAGTEVRGASRAQRPEEQPAPVTG